MQILLMADAKILTNAQIKIKNNIFRTITSSSLIFFLRLLLVAVEYIINHNTFLISQRYKLHFVQLLPTIFSMHSQHNQAILLLVA